MNENLNLVEILKDCPKGTKLYSTAFGEVELDYVDTRSNYPIVIRTEEGERESFTTEGKLCAVYNGECILFPSRKNRDWSKFNPKKDRFDLKTLRPFDKVLVKIGSYWRIELFSHMHEYKGDIYYACAMSSYKECIPYNGETKHLVNTSEEAPKFYRNWED